MHYPTDVNLLWDALRCLIRVVAWACEQYGLGGWRQSAHLRWKVRGLFNRVRSSKRRKNQPQRVKDYVRQARRIAERARTRGSSVKSNTSWTTRSGLGSGTGRLPGGRGARAVRKVSGPGFETGDGMAVRGKTGLETAPDARTVTRFTYTPEQNSRVLSQTLLNRGLSIGCALPPCRALAPGGDEESGEDAAQAPVPAAELVPGGPRPLFRCGGGFQQQVESH